jgi:hypothetical protein
MDRSTRSSIGRRDLLRVLAIGTASAAATGVAPPATADTETPDEKRKTRYQADSPEVQTFYRVNRYPTS